MDAGIDRVKNVESSVLLSGKDYCEDVVTRLPSKVCNIVLPIQVKLSQNCLTAKNGKGKRYSTIRSNFPVPINNYFYYFEITIDSLNNEMVIGFIERNFETILQIGNSLHSVGFTSNSYIAKKSTKETIPHHHYWYNKDVVGCGKLFNTKEVFLTKNGELLAKTSDVSSKSIYPAVTLYGAKDKVTFNFGQSPFSFDIRRFVDKDRELFIEKLRIKPNFKILDNLNNHFIAQYLVYNGYKDTYEALSKMSDEFKIAEEVPEDSSLSIQLRTLRFRKLILELIRNNDIENALKKIQIYFAQIHPRALYLLNCQLFLNILLNSNVKSAIEFAKKNLRNCHIIKKPYSLMKYVLLSKDELSKHQVFTPQHLNRLADRINKEILKSINVSNLDPLELFFKQFFAVDALYRQENDFFGLPYSLTEY